MNEPTTFIRVLRAYAARAHDNESYRCLVPEVVLRDAAEIIADSRHREAEARGAVLREVRAEVATMPPWLSTDNAAGRAMGEPGAVDVVARSGVFAAIDRRLEAET